MQKSKEVRNKETFLRSGFYAADKYDLPVIYKQDIALDELVADWVSQNKITGYKRE